MGRVRSGALWALVSRDSWPEGEKSALIPCPTGHSGGMLTGMTRVLGIAVLWVFALCAGAAAQPGIATPGDCLAAGTDPHTPPQRRVSGLLRRLAPVLEVLPSLQAALGGQGPDICLSAHLFEEHGYMEADGGRIVLNARLDDDILLAILLHELRHLDQFATSVCPSPDLSMQETARSVMALEADASAVMLLGAWWLRQQGDPGPWRAIEDWPSARDIAARFAEEMAASDTPRSAASAAFDQWYRSPERVEQYYLSICSDYLARVEESKALPRYQLVPPDYFEQLCRLPDGTPYPCAEPDGAFPR
ncbi:DUF6782 family putative metallopeptidase [Thalassovita aquimarina]|uniref:DUF6782 domain-containing protein n=1 Tax=Thalassovita aquimarina TaxID=2785917 RepID=A0ABS5HW19_9RHOB|nr:DUF6782 family putative metallopeptidase [Thalassovita aquimarina]MBR9653153.1 hypothetical protein [Thalassovita aquimarina]